MRKCVGFGVAIATKTVTVFLIYGGLPYQKALVNVSNLIL